MKVTSHSLTVREKMYFFIFLKKNIEKSKILLPPRGSFVIVIFGVVVKSCYNCFPRC